MVSTVHSYGKKNKRYLSSLQTWQFLLVGRNFLPPGAGYPSYPTAHHPTFILPVTEIIVIKRIANILTIIRPGGTDSAPKNP